MSTSYWLSPEADRGDEESPDQIPTSSTVVIIGGGLMGVAAAYGLVECGVDVVVLEAGELASGATGRNVGVFMPGLRPVEDVRLVHSVLGREEIDADFRRCGHLALASTPSVLDDFEAEASRRPSTASPLRILDHTGCEELSGMRISPRFVGGRWMPDGHVINPVRFVRGLAHAARRRGATIVPHTRAVGILSAGRGHLTVQTEVRSIRTTHVVYACNSSLTRLAPHAPLLRARRGQVLATEPLPRLFSIGMAVDFGRVYWRQTDDGTVLIGGYRSEAVGNEEETDADQVTPRIQRALETFLPNAFPGFPPLQVRLRWAGTMDCSADGRPVVGRLPGHDRQWVIAGFGGHGLPAGLGAGIALAQAIATNQTIPALAAFDPARLKFQTTKGPSRVT